jgi:hypothetical protein
LPPKLGLVDLVNALRLELEIAQKQFAPGRDAMLYLETAEAEVNFVVEAADTARGGVRVYFVTVEGKHEYKSLNVHKLKLILKPGKGQPPIRVAGPSSAKEHPQSGR